MRPKLVLLSLCGWVAASGCSALNVRQPTASFQSMKIAGATPEGLTVHFMVDLTNPNPVSLPVTAADYQISVAGTKITSSEAKLDSGLPASGSTTVTLPVVFKFEDLLKAEKSIVASKGDLPFDLSGGMTFRAASWLPGQDIRVPVSYTGKLPLKQYLQDPQIILNSPAARELAQKTLTGLLNKF